MLCQLCDDGFFNMPYPDAMIGYSAKDALVKLTSMILLLTIHSNSSLSSSLRKGRAYSSKIADLQVKGFGVCQLWKLKRIFLIQTRKFTVRKQRIIMWNTGNLELSWDFAKSIFISDNGMLVDMPFLPRIKGLKFDY